MFDHLLTGASRDHGNPSLEWHQYATSHECVGLVFILLVNTPPFQTNIDPTNGWKWMEDSFPLLHILLLGTCGLVGWYISFIPKITASSIIGCIIWLVISSALIKICKNWSSAPIGTKASALQLRVRVQNYVRMSCHKENPGRWSKLQFYIFRGISQLFPKVWFWHVLTYLWLMKQTRQKSNAAMWLSTSAYLQFDVALESTFKQLQIAPCNPHQSVARVCDHP